MKELFYYIHIYRLIVAQYIKARLNYRVDFIISFFGMLFRDLTGLFALWIIFKSIPAIEGWNYYELVFLYSFSLLALTPLQLFFDSVWELPFKIVEGSFIKYYFKPLNMMFYFMSEIFDIKGLSQLLFAGTGLLYASVHLGLEWHAGNAALFVLLVCSAALIMISLMIIGAASNFYMINHYALLGFIFDLRELARYPLSIFNSFFKYFFTCIVPIGFIAYYPMLVLLRPGTTTYTIYICPIVGIGLFSIACVVWARGVRRYSGTGS